MILYIYQSIYTKNVGCLFILTQVFVDNELQYYIESVIRNHQQISKKMVNGDSITHFRKLCMGKGCLHGFPYGEYRYGNPEKFSPFCT